MRGDAKTIVSDKSAGDLTLVLPTETAATFMNAANDSPVQKADALFQQNAKAVSVEKPGRKPAMHPNDNKNSLRHNSTYKRS